MIERDSLEQAGLEALGLLDGAERAAFQREHRVNAELRSATREFRDLVAIIGTTACADLPSETNLDLIMARIGTATSSSRGGRPRRPAWSRSLAPTWVPWAAAALFAVLAAWLASSNLSMRANRPGTQASGAAEPESRSVTAGETLRVPGGAAGSARFHPGAPEARGSVVPGSRPARFFANGRSGPEARVLDQDAGRLRSELDKLRATESARHNLPDGISDLRVVEMRPPGTARTPETRDLLSSRVTDAIASGLSQKPAGDPSSAGSTDPKPSGPVQLSGQGAKPNSDIILTEGLVNLGSLNLHPDAQVIHRNFPPPSDYARQGLVPIDANTVWDGYGGVWHRAPDGQSWIGQKAPPEWQPPDPGESPPPAPPLRPAPRTPDSPGGTSVEGAAASSLEPYALPILDHSGKGTLIVQNLPPAAAGEAYHLWLNDPRFAEPISVGILPPLISPNDRFDFELGAPGFVPTGYFLTAEPAHPGGATDRQPGRIILQGP